jgi:AhpD family alkylhydroperoxidase
MNARIDLTQNLKFFQPLFAVQAAIEHAGFDKKLLHLLELRASQINNCAYCIDMHSKDARVEGETEQRLYGVSAWRETPYFTDRERAALEWTEAVTLVAATGVPDAAYEAARAHFSEDELKTLTLAITMINVWNRINVAFRTVPGDYKPGMFRTVNQAAS